MIDIDFYMKIYPFKYEVMGENAGKYDKKYVFDLLESCRSKNPVIYNFETTNACNMRCAMCPRTTMMTRPIETIDMATFEKVADQLTPYSDAKWNEWVEFVEKNYGIGRDDMSENHFFLCIIPRVIVMHGYGDPLLDKDIAGKIRILSRKGLPSYFSCNPANISIERTVEMFESGLNYIKYSIESTDDAKHKEIRGSASNFTESYNKICQLLDLKKRNDYRTVIVITMLNLNNESQEAEFARLRECFAGKDVYIYLKSQDQHWYQDKAISTKSIHWTEFCQFPWSSMTIKSNGESVECVEDFNNEIVLGNAKTESLYDIWNGERYRKFRWDHLDLTKGIKCTEQCDMKLIGSLI